MKGLEEIKAYALLFFVVIVLLIGCKKTDDTTVEKIIKKDPVISWANPNDITFLTPLTDKQLNATADLLGKFVYTPPIGVILSEGYYQKLNVHFTPTDTLNYNTATKTVKIDVIENTNSTIKDYDGNSYHTIVIGSQTWTLENLKVTHYNNGALISNVLENSDWTTLKTGAYCIYNNQAANKNIYGVLYNWYAIADSRKIAPIGWHVPTKADWTQLITYLGGFGVAGGKLKEYGSSHWLGPNISTNMSGFTALPSGNRLPDGRFQYLYKYTGFWTIGDEIVSTNAYSLNLFNNRADIYFYNDPKEFGFPVRLVKD